MVLHKIVNKTFLKIKARVSLKLKQLCLKVIKFFKYVIFFIHRTNEIKKMLNKVSYKIIQVVSHGHCFTTFE